MTRAERLELARKLLDDGRLSAHDISSIVGRSRNWVRKIAREHSRNARIEFVLPPKPARNVAKRVVDAPPRRARTVRRRSRRSVYPNKFWCWLDRLGALGLLGLTIFGVWHGDLVVREGEKRLTFQAPRVPLEGGAAP